MQNKAFQAFINRLGRSRFFTISVALHFLFVVTFGTVVLVRQIPPRNDFEDSGGQLVAPPPATQEDQIQPLQPANPEAATTSNTQPTGISASALSVDSAVASSFSLPTNPATTVPTLGKNFAPNTGAASAVTPKIGNIPVAIAKGIIQTIRGWRANGDSGSGVGKDRTFKFTAFVAQYAGGDWDATIKRGADGKITMGSLPNLLYIVRKWSRDKIDADIEPVPLNIGTDELLAKKPPFIFFTGHHDFKLNDKEVENLQKYLQLGGAVWGDSSLPGSRSRFDLAFRREMKRVLPDNDISWAALPPDHALFTKKYFPEVQGVPSGLNYYQEPVYALKIYDEIAVIYTPNDYGDMWQIGIDEKGDYDMRRDENNRLTAINEPMFDKRDVYFRNLELKPLNESYKFGTNIILHLLTRWDDKMRNVPTGL